MNKVLFLVTLGFSVVFSTNASLINFDDLNDPDGTALSTYDGFTWKNFYLSNGADDATSYPARVSPNNFIYNYSSFGGNPEITSSGTFNLVSAYLTAPLTTDGSITIYGLLDGKQVWQQTVEINHLTPTFVYFNNTNEINDVVFHTGDVQGVAIDNLKVWTFAAVPEPDTYLSALGLVGMFFLLLKKRI